MQTPQRFQFGFHRFALPDMQPYFGNLHSHTSFSDGHSTPEHAYQMARESGLDFLALTEHNHSAASGDDGVALTPRLYDELKQTARKYSLPGQFAALYGQEFSSISKGNHINVFEANSIIDVPNGEFKMMYEQWLPAHPEVPFIQLNHPNYKRDLDLNTPPPSVFHRPALNTAVRPTFHVASHTGMPHEEENEIDGDSKYNDYGYDDYNRDFQALAQAANPYAQTIEILNGPGTINQILGKVEAQHEDDYLFYLNQGFRIGPTADQDNHFENWGYMSFARTGVLASSLTRETLYDALRKRRVFATEDKNLSLIFRANEHYMGEIFPSTPSVSFQVQLRDQDEPGASYTVEIFLDRVGGEVAKPLFQANGGQAKTFTFLWKATDKGEFYALAKVTQTNADGTQDEAWSAPVWMQF